MDPEKLKIRFRSYSTLVIIILISFADKLSGQDKIIISGGFGIPELVYGGVKYQKNQMQMGLTLGFFPVFSYFTGSVTGDFYYHLLGSSKFSEIRPWYGKIGLSYLKDETYHFKDKYFYSNLRFGRDFNISKKAGIDIYGGFSFQLYHSRQIKVEYYSPFGYYEDYMPISLGISFFYKL